jgi:hypothetical protein
VLCCDKKKQEMSAQEQPQRYDDPQRGRAQLLIIIILFSLSYTNKILILYMRGNGMSKRDYGEWVVDLGAMTCCNTCTRIVVEFEKNGIGYNGKIKDMPFELMKQWAKTEHGEQIIRRMVEEAEELFFKAYIENDVENMRGGKTDVL